jgi:ferrous iron transport protein B
MVALLGNPNCGKTALFNRLTGARQKVANYAGVTIERKEGAFTAGAATPARARPAGRLQPVGHTPDEEITRDVVAGLRRGEPAPDVVVCVVDATNLRLNLRLVLEVKRLGLPMLLALNMVDVGEARHHHRRGQAVAGTGHAGGGNRGGAGTAAKSPAARLDAMCRCRRAAKPLAAIDAVSVEETQREVRRILAAVSNDASDKGNLSERSTTWCCTRSSARSSWRC